MQEQNFEKQVKQKLEELSVAPSAPVWMKVEEQIRQKRSKRRIFFWIFPLGILLAGGIVYSLTRYNNQPVAVKYQPVKQESAKPVNQFSNQQPATDESKADKTTIMQGIEIADRAAARQSNPVSAGNKTAQNFLLVNSRLKTTKQKQETRSSSVKSGEETPSAIVNRIDATDETASATIQEKNTKTSVADSTANASPTVTTPQPVEEKPAAENPPAAIIHPGEKRKWQISAYAAVGLSSLEYATGAREKNANQYNFSPTSPGIGSAVPPPQRVSMPEKGLSFQLGVKFMKPVSRRLNVTVGLGYYYASTKQKIGQLVAEDSVFRNNFTSPVTVSRYYRVGSTENYTNSYHFIEIPVGINWRVNKKIPLDLETGLSIAQMVASNALTYDGNGNYYRNNKLLYRTHVTFNGALSYRILNIRQHAVYAGPYFKYHLTQLEKSNSGQFLFSAGLGISMKF
jgi:hypothetical protein